MQPISVEAFASMVMKNNKGYRKKELVKTLNEWSHFCSVMRAHENALLRLFST